MATKVNGAEITWLAYEFGTREPDGTIKVFGTKEHAQFHIDRVAPRDTKLVFRAVYCTGWEDVIK